MNRRKREGEKSQNKNILYVHMRASGFMYIKKKRVMRRYFWEGRKTTLKILNTYVNRSAAEYEHAKKKKS